MKRIVIYTVDGREFEYEGNLAEGLFSALEDAGARGAGWTTPVVLNNGRNSIFVLNNIASFHYYEVDKK